MVIDDEHDLRLTLSKRLTANNYVVETAIDGQDGLNKIDAFQPDLILLDVMMNKMNGYEFCKNIRKDKK